MDQQAMAMAYAYPTLGPSFWFGYTIVILAFYVYMALALQAIAKKTKTPNTWFAWIPVLNIILMLQIAGKPLWWIILLLIPFVNVIAGIVITIIAWMRIAEKCHKPNWWGILMIVPIVNFVVPGYLAWSK